MKFRKTITEVCVWIVTCFYDILSASGLDLRTPWSIPLEQVLHNMNNILETGQDTGQALPTVCIQHNDEAFLVLLCTRTREARAVARSADS